MIAWRTDLGEARIRIAELESELRDAWAECDRWTSKHDGLREALERIDAEATEFTLPAVLISREALAGGGQ